MTGLAVPPSQTTAFNPAGVTLDLLKQLGYSGDAAQLQKDASNNVTVIRIEGEVVGFLPAAGLPPTIGNIQTIDPGLPDNLQELWDQKIIAGFVQRHSMDFLLNELRKIVEGS
ncbi:hypothetical protein [Bremerella cremea]|uniref:hypothetical protein n=1 Tax=Bremerella cremea TaxID=1031537 RepID=UPI0031F17D86